MHCITDSGSLDTLSQTRSSLLISEWHLLENVLHADPTPSFFSFHILIYFIFNLCGCIFVGYATNWKFQFSSVVQSCLTLCDPMDCNTTHHPVHCQLLEFTQTHVIELMMPSNHHILCHPLLLLPSVFPATGSFQMSQLFASGGQNIGVSALAAVLPINTRTDPL